jgi:hypothetical protein
MGLTYPMDIGRNYLKGIECLVVKLFVIIIIYYPGY